MEKYPEINVSLIGARIKILNNNNQRWLRTGQELTVRAITNNNKFLFFEDKYAWGCSDNGKHKYFEVLSTVGGKIDAKAIKQQILTSNKDADEVLRLLDKLVDAAEHNQKLAAV